jgi:N-acetylglucosaminyldiphosphoundecaprenol N-acetyl-beta-D-mannosaminyltransferase
MLSVQQRRAAIYPPFIFRERGAMNGRANVLGVGVSAIDIPTAVATIDRWIAAGAKEYVTVTGVHGVMESQRDEALRHIHNRAGMVTPDGMPLVWMNKLQGNKHVTRVYGPDLMLAVCAQSVEKGHRHFFYGGAEGVPELLSQKLTARFPGLHTAGCYSPPFRALTTQEEADVIRMIDDAGTDIVWVGLSTPKQERWMAAFRDRLQAPVLIGVGAAFDFHAGLKQQAPLWMQRNGLEWFYRLLSEPRRLGRRYLVNNPLFLLGVLGQMLGVRKYSLDQE